MRTPFVSRTPPSLHLSHHARTALKRASLLPTHARATDALQGPTCSSEGTNNPTPIRPVTLHKDDDNKGAGIGADAGRGRKERRGAARDSS